MYYVLIYIIIAFLFYVLTNNTGKIVEGQTLESYSYSAFQPIHTDEIIEDQLKDHLNKYEDDIDEILKNTLDEARVNSMIDEQIESDEPKTNILYDIYIRDVLGAQTQTKYDEETYEQYIKNFVEFNKNEEILKNIPYSENQMNLFKNKYKKTVLYSNDYDYIDINDTKELINDENKHYPGFISKSDNYVKNNMITEEEPIYIKDIEFCCDYSLLNIENMPIITKEEENNINKRKRDFTREIIPEEKHGVYEYNRPYYKYMGEGGRIYDSLYKYYRKTSDVGGINL